MVDDEQKVEEQSVEEQSVEEQSVEGAPVEEAKEEPVNFIEDAPEAPVAPESEVKPEASADEFEKGVNVDAPADPSMVLNLEGTSDEFPAFAPVPLAWYDAIVENADYTQSKAGNPMIKWDFLLTDPNYANRHIFNNCVIKIKDKITGKLILNEIGISMFKRIVIRLGIEVDWSKIDIPKFCAEGRALGKAIRIRVGLSKKPYKDSRTGQMVRSNTVTDVAPAGSGDDFLADSQ